MQILFFGTESLFADCLDKALPRHCHVNNVITSQDAINQLDGNAKVDLMLINMTRNQQQGMALLRHITGGGLLPHVVVLADDAAILQLCRDYGARGGVLANQCNAKTLYEVLRAVLAGAAVWPGNLDAMVSDVSLPHLTARQMEVLQRMAEGMSNRMIGESLGIKEVTVKTHVTALCDAFDERTRGACVARARDLGILE